MIEKKWVVVLVIIALVLAGASVSYNIIDKGETVQKTNYYTTINSKDFENGKVGVTVAQKPVEDKSG